MSRNALFYLIGIVVFVSLAGYALWQELLRNETELSGSLSGTILATPRAGAEIVKTDNAYLLLVDPDSFQIVTTQIAQSAVSGWPSQLTSGAPNNAPIWFRTPKDGV